MERGAREGESPVCGCALPDDAGLSKSRVVWDCSSKWEVNFHLKLNIDGKPIANKYREGKMKRTLKRELKDLKSLRRKR